MLNYTFWALAVLLSSLAQCAEPGSPAVEPPEKEAIVAAHGFVERTIDADGATVHFYQHGGTGGDVGRLVVYLQGSNPSPQFFWREDDGAARPMSWIPRDYDRLRNGDVYVVIEKPGFEGVFPEEIEEVPAAYHRANSLDDRVMRADRVIDLLVAETPFDKVVVYGHSEGAPVAAKLATVNPHITHVGFWAGSALSDFFDFALEARLAAHKGEATFEEAQGEIDAAIGYFAEVIANDRAGTDVDDFGYTHKRWFSYAEPPINHLVRIDVPLFVQVATRDESAPIESTYMIPLEFARLGKTNLEYRVCLGCDHGFFVTGEGGVRERKWPQIFSDFMVWVDEN